MPSSLYQTADAVFTARQGQPLLDWIAAQRGHDRTWRQISYDLRDATDGAVDVPPQTLINWMQGAAA